MKWLAIIAVCFLIAMTIYGTKEARRQEAACQAIGMHHFHMRDGSEVCLPSRSIPEQSK